MKGLALGMRFETACGQARDYVDRLAKTDAWGDAYSWLAW